MAKVLSIAFLNEMGKKTSISITDVKDDVTAAEAKACALEIIKNNIFHTAGGDLVKLDSAQIVDKAVSVLDIA